MKIGLDHYTIGHLKLNARETLDFAVEHHLGGVQFEEAHQLSPTLDAGELRAVKEYADERGLSLEVGIPSINPFRVPEGQGDPPSVAAWLEPYVRAGAAAGSPFLRTLIGWLHDRYDEEVPWADQLTGATRVLQHLAPLARDLGVRFAVETHMDATTFELLRLIETVGEEVVGICLDTGNLTTRLEDPMAATQRVAPYVIATHTKDSILFFADDGLRWQARPCGQGAIPLREMLRCLGEYVPDLTLSLEDHPRIYPLPIFDPAWLGSYSDLTPQELAALIQRARACEQRIAAGEIPDPETLEAIPWPERVESRLKASRSFLHTVLAEEGLLSNPSGS